MATTISRRANCLLDVMSTHLDGVVVIESRRSQDTRGYFLEAWKGSLLIEIGCKKPIVQDNVTWSHRGVLRGLHLQSPHDQDKLVSVLAGEVFDVVVDARFGSPTFGQWISISLSSDNGRQLFVPAGFAHGFCALSEGALVTYKCTEEYHPESELTIAWNDPQIGIRWPIESPLLSAKDSAAKCLDEIPIVRLPKWTPH